MWRWLWSCLPGLLPAATFLVWHALGTPSGGGGTLPQPEAVLETLWRLLESGELQRHSWVSLQRAIAGFTDPRSFRRAQARAIAADHGWERAARLYERLYRSLETQRTAAAAPL